MESSYGWGLIGPGRFAREFATELVSNKRAHCIGVASRRLSKATEFANEFGFEKVYNDYEELVNDDEVDIVYVVVPHVFHRKIAEMALRAGKPVLCEKPLTPGFAESEKLVSLARERQVFLMEAMKTGFLPAIQGALKWLNDGRIGNPKILKADFCFPGPTDPGDRLMNPDLGGGAVLDVGIYPLYLASHFLGEVNSVRAHGSIASTGVEDTAVITTQHQSGALAVLSCSFQTDSEALDACILGTEGSIHLPDFHKATKAELWKHGTISDTIEDDSGGMVNAEINAVMDSLDRGELECPEHNHNDTLRLARLMDEVRRCF